MNIFDKSLSLTFTALVWLLSSSSAEAGILRNGWMYAIDPSDDGIGSVQLDDGSRRVQAGGTINEIFGLAIHEDLVNNRIWVAINSNMPVEGNITGPQIVADTGTFNVEGGVVAWGDLFFDFRDQERNYQQAHEQSDLYGVRFTTNSDNAADFGRGVYENVSGIGVGHLNAGFNNLASYNSLVQNLNGQDSWMGALPWDSPYFGQYSQPFDSNLNNRMPNIIGSGDLVSDDVIIHSQEELEAQGFSLQHFFQQGSEVFGFSFVRPMGFVGDFIATLLQECLNDGISLLGTFSNVNLVEEPPADPIEEPPDDPGESDDEDENGGDSNTDDSSGEPSSDNPDLDSSIVMRPEFRDCPVSPGQRYALQPSRIEDGIKYIDNGVSHAWYDPPPYENYEIRLGDGTLITEILQFPCGLIGKYPEEVPSGYLGEQFEVWVGNIRIPQIFNPGEGVRFQDHESILNTLLREGENGRLGVESVVVRGLTVCVGNADEASSVCQQRPRDPRPYICDNSGEATSFCIQLALSQARPDGPVMIGPEPVPEPATIFGTIAFGGVLAKLARSRRKSD
jgi:hypothetical protein